MRYLTSSAISFDVGHATPHPVECERQHGHRATVTVGIAGKPVPEHGSYTVDPAVLADTLGAIARELDRRDLNEMIAPAKPTAAGLAGWVWHRLALGWGEALAFVEVELGAGLAARIEA